MAKFDEKQLKAHLKTKELFPVYLIYGNEDYLKKFYTDSIASVCVEPAFESFNLEKFEGKDISLDDVFERASIMPMMSERRCIIIEDFKLEGAEEGVIEKLEEYFLGTPDTCVIIFLQKKAEFSCAKAGKAVDIISKYGAVCQLDKRKGAALTSPLIASAKKNGCLLTPKMADYLVSCVGDDYNVLVNELYKLCNYAAGGEITKQHIDAVAVKSDDAKAYDLTKALIQKNFDKAYKVLHTLLSQKVQPQFILGVIAGTYIDMYRGRVSLSCGEKAEALGEIFFYGKGVYRLSNGARDSSAMDLPTLRKCLEVLAQADMQIKKSHDDDTIVLEQLMVRLFLVANGERV